VRLLALLLSCSLLAIGCRANAPVYNIRDAPVSASKARPSLEEVGVAIRRAGTSLGWRMTPREPGHIQGTLYVRTHVAVVDVNYTTRAYSIRYADSTDLNFDGDSIHPNYNRWIQKLDDAIRAQLLAL
jgi:hypothetical protein